MGGRTIHRTRFGVAALVLLGAALALALGATSARSDVPGTYTVRAKGTDRTGNETIQSATVTVS